jgi:hypothetical protein
MRAVVTVAHKQNSCHKLTALRGEHMFLLSQSEEEII